MFTAEFEGINSFLVGTAKILLENGVERTTRGMKCWELPSPVMIKISNPLARWVTIPERKWSLSLPYAESLWLALGHNDLEFIKYYLPKMEAFSDDKEFLRGGYGPRLRYYNGNLQDYQQPHKNTVSKLTVDQIRYVVEKVKQDPFTRQAIITIGDPSKDCFDRHGSLKQTKDFPCTRSLQFIKNAQTNKLDVIAHLRSNDFIWGATGVNVFNYTFMQEYIAQILNLEVGCYYHIVNNMHYYEYHKELVQKLANVTNYTDDYFNYNKSFHTLKNFDILLAELELWEYELRVGKTKQIKNFGDDFFNDWANVLFTKNRNNLINFINPILNIITQYYK